VYGMNVSSSNKIETVLGPVVADWQGVVDAHNHVWISRLPGIPSNSPALDNPTLILNELNEYSQESGVAILDCQPGGCGRDGSQLVWLSRQSGVHIVGCTGFHRRRYYPPELGLWQEDASQLNTRFISELQYGMQETLANDVPVRAGFIKVGVEARLEDTPQGVLEAAAFAAAQTQAAIEVHTEKGAEAERILDFFIACGVLPRKIILCHMDKRPDFGLHCELAQAGVLLEYDTFYRPRYDPETYLWPLIHKMVAAGFDYSVALATDMAETHFWKQFGGSPGLIGLVRLIRPRLLTEGIPQPSVEKLMGKNITVRLAVQDLPSVTSRS
jgi:predicted metal-dependent phosphotriesterase family hydrolase